MALDNVKKYKSDKLRVAGLTSGRDRPEAIDDLFGIDEPAEDDVADIFGGVAAVCGAGRFDFYHENGLFYAVKPHFFVFVPETEVEFLDVGGAPPSGLIPLAADSPDATDDPAVG
jgi:hypothetical protein